MDRKPEPMPAQVGLVDNVVRLGLAALIVFWSLLLLKPFIAILLWAAVLSVALFPVHGWLSRALGGRKTVAAFLLTTFSLLLILGPLAAIVSALVSNLTQIASDMTGSGVSLPPPPPEIATWPLVGEKLTSIWAGAVAELDETLASFVPQLKELARATIGAVGNLGLSLLQFAVAIIIAGFIYGRADTIQSFLVRFAGRTAPRMGEGFVDLASKTVRGVARGVVGISLAQSILFGIGVLAAAVPLAGLWTFLVLLLAIIQIGPALVIIPVIIYAWTSMETLAAILLTVYLIPVMLMDNVLKPIVMGRGLPVPMLVIFIGVIGGTIAHGLIGLFVGPIILSIGYELVRAWIAQDTRASEA
jgi:predicted PurR-regulated permease PerM